MAVRLSSQFDRLSERQPTWKEGNCMKESFSDTTNETAAKQTAELLYDPTILLALQGAARCGGEGLHLLQGVMERLGRSSSAVRKVFQGRSSDLVIIREVAELYGYEVHVNFIPAKNAEPQLKISLTSQASGGTTS